MILAGNLLIEVMLDGVRLDFGLGNRIKHAVMSKWCVRVDSLAVNGLDAEIDARGKGEFASRRNGS